MIRDFFIDKQDKKDNLTEVYNREVIEEYAIHLIDSNRPFTFAILDIDNFKYINDNYGHLYGDIVLKQMAAAMTKILGNKAVVGRYGGDEFIIIIEDVVDYDQIWNIFHDLLGTPQYLEDKRLVELNMSVTLGSARFPLNAKNIDELFELADKALYRGKMKGRNCFIIYLPEKHADINLKTQRDRIINPSYLHTKAFYSLTRSKNITTGIREIINFLGDYYMIDHLCIDTGEGLYFNYYHKLCKRRDFKPLPKSVVKQAINPAMDLCMINYITEEESTMTKINNVLYKENITALLMCNISVYGVDYGIIRAEICSIGSGRIWQDDEKVVFLNLAHMIALILYYQNKKIEDL